MKRTLSAEHKHAIVWFQRQPGVTSVVAGRYTAAKHHHKPGFARVSTADQTSVHVRTYDKGGVRDLFVHAAPGPLRDRWVAALTAGADLSANRVGPTLAKLKAAIKPITGARQD